MSTERMSRSFLEMSAERMCRSFPLESTEYVQVSIDSSILDCPICFEPLQLPLFQCINGHVACSECSTKLVAKCPICFTFDTSRCIPFESIIGSNKVKCPYTKYGCRNSLPHNQIATHKSNCVYGPCTCPIPDCNYECNGISLSSHIAKNHTGFGQKKAFEYNEWFSVLIQKEQPYVLQGLINVYVLVSRRVELGYAFWIAHVCASAEMSYELEVVSVDGNSLKLKGKTKNVRNLDEEGSPEFFMYVPRNFLTSTGHLNVKIKMLN